VRVVKPGGEEESFYVSGGVLEVQPHVVTILSDTGQRAHDLDEAKALEAKQRAEQTLADKSADIDYAKAQAELAEAVAQLQAIQRLRKRLGR
jgi:F-type H+-transporting ATPase subunit epsilon